MRREKIKFLKRLTVLIIAAAIIFTNASGSLSSCFAAVGKTRFDSSGRMIAYFGSPVIDGNVDEVWNKAYSVAPVTSSGTTNTSATFKALWDDNALYILAKVRDNCLSTESSTVYSRDCIEIFLDETNDKTHDFDVDDLQFRVNYKNVQSADHGDLIRFYTKTKKETGGYTIEARIAFEEPPANGKVMGVELQVNDAKDGKRIATLNVFDQTGTAYMDTERFGEIILTGKADGAVSGRNPYDLENLVKSAEEIILERYINGDMVQTFITQAKAIISDEASSQTQINTVYAALEKAIKELIHTNHSYDKKECRQIPSEYKTKDKQRGTIIRLNYTTHTYDTINKTLYKYLNVYLPYGYDAADSNTKYNVLYLVHGMGENQNTVLGGPGKSTEMMKLLDNMIANGDMEPLIVVTPTWYNEGVTNMFGLVKNFHNELTKDIIPLIESSYNTYASSTLEADLITSRDHRAFGGFSMGSGCTWYTYINCLDYFKYFIPISAACMEDISGLEYEGNSSEQMAKYLANVPVKYGYGPKDYYIFCATGTDDLAYLGMLKQIEAMKSRKESFLYSADLSKGNFYFLELGGGTHTWNCVNRYLYNMLPDLFRTY